MKFYAQIDQVSGGICFSVAQLAGPVTAADMIELPAFDETILGKKWDGATWLAWNGTSWI